jgi:hypothetical protein
MLAVKSYDPGYVDACTSMIAGRLATLEAVLAAAPSGTGRAPFDALERDACADLVLVLDRCFVHRTRAVEGKDGNALNEVRMLTDSILAGGAVLRADGTIRYRPEASVLHLAVGDPIVLDVGMLRRLADAFIAGIRERFG